MHVCERAHIVCERMRRRRRASESRRPHCQAYSASIPCYSLLQFLQILLLLCCCTLHNSMLVHGVMEFSAGYSSCGDYFLLALLAPVLCIPSHRASHPSSLSLSFHFHTFLISFHPLHSHSRHNAKLTSNIFFYFIRKLSRLIQIFALSSWDRFLFIFRLSIYA